MKDRISAWRWFWPWEDMKEERWLEEMESKGWHLRRGPICYGFDRCAPVQVRYRLDYHTDRKDMDDYLAIFRDSGWERVMVYGGWQYFRTTNPDAPEIFTDAASRIAKYQRFFGFLCIVAIPLLLCNLPTLINNWQPGGLVDTLQHSIVWVVLVLYAFWVYVLARLALFIRKLKKQSKSADSAQRTI
jgi:hypothetical protein